MTVSPYQASDYEGAADAEDWPPPGDLGETGAVADYLADMIGQLEDIARRSQLDLLSYLLSMAKSEAQVHARAEAGRPIAPA